MNWRESVLVQILIRAVWIALWITFALWVLVGGRLSLATVDIPRFYGFCVLISGIVQLSKQSKPQEEKPRAYIDIVAEMLKGDRAAAQRLFNYTKDRFGGKTDEWIWQKVIRDIERDRR